MRVLMVDVMCGIQSTGRICTDLASMLESRGDQCKCAYGRGEVPNPYGTIALKIGKKYDIYFHAFKARIFDSVGFGSKNATKKLIHQIESFDPDIIHLHDLHGYHINVDILFQYLKKRNKPVVWSFYDCWAFTGHCAHYDYNGCKKWQFGCKKCAYKHDYPKTILFSRSRQNYEKKKDLFTAVQQLNIIAPSDWMKAQVQKSFLSSFPIFVMPNGIDLSSFCANRFITKEDLHLQDKFVILCVANVWGKMKGIYDILRLANDLPEQYRIIMVGQIPKNTNLPKNILHVRRTDNIKQLCGYYTLADVFVNPTLQETQGLTTVEAFACGTPPVVYRSGGAAECVDDTCGISVERGDYQELKNAILAMGKGELHFTKEACRAKAEAYDKNQLYLPFLDLYDELYTGSLSNYSTKDKRK